MRFGGRYAELKRRVADLESHERWRGVMPQPPVGDGTRLNDHYSLAMMAAIRAVAGDGDIDTFAHGTGLSRETVRRAFEAAGVDVQSTAQVAS